MSALGRFVVTSIRSGIARDKSFTVATRGALGHPKGSGAPSGRRALLAVLALTLFVLALVAVPAFAAAPIYSSSFGSFTNPESIAVDQSSGDVYVFDVGSSSIKRFTAAGAPDPFSASVPYINENELTGTTEGGFPLEPGGSENQIAIAPGGALGGTAGDLYVTESAGGAVAIFASTGEYLGRLSETGGGGFGGEVCGVATDPAGNLYVGTFGGTVDKFVPSANPPTNADYDSQITGLGGICDIAASSTAVYAATWSSGPLVRYPTSLFPGSGGSADASGSGSAIDNLANAVALDSQSADVYSDEGNRIAPFDSSGTPLAAFATRGQGSRGVALSEGADHLYVSNPASGQVDVFAPPPAIPPSVDSTSATDVTATSANLRAQVNPNFFPTQVYFEYEAETAPGVYGPPQSTPASALGELGSDQAVSAHLQGLAPETMYRFRAVADNGNGPPATSSDRVFSTTPLAPPAALPDGRAYEMVSPADKNGGDIVGIDGVQEGGVVQASPDGDAITYLSFMPFGAEPQGNPPGNQYLSHRAAGSGWSTQNITPPLRSGSYSVAGGGSPYKAFSTNLSSALLLGQGRPPFPGPAGYGDYFLRTSATGALQPFLAGIPKREGEEVMPKLEFGLSFQLLAYSPDLRHALLYSPAVLSQNATYTGQSNLYMWSAQTGEFEAVNLLPGESKTSVPAFPGSGGGESNLVSSDGSRVFWTKKQAAESTLNVREGLGTPQVKTVQVDASQGPGSGGEGIFSLATPSGSKVFFLDDLPLTPDSTACGGGCGSPDLYEFDLESEQLSDLSIAATPGETAAVKGVLGASDDGSYVYFVAGGDLTGSQQNEFGDEAQVGELNLYLSHEGALTFIADLSAHDPTDWDVVVYNRTARVTPDGRHLAFLASSSPTGYDNVDQRTGESDAEVYLYGAESGQLRCASCNPTGASPIGPSTIPAGTGYANNQASYQSRVLSDDGSRLFFETADSLTARDTNGRGGCPRAKVSNLEACRDVYEYEHGHASLISSGTDGRASRFLDASRSGDDVFFLTASRLDPTDLDTSFDVYDARAPHFAGEAVGSPPPPPTPPACEGDSCQSPAQTPNRTVPGTTTFSGPGNIATSSKHRRHHRHHAKRGPSRGKHANPHRKASR